MANDKELTDRITCEVYIKAGYLWARSRAGKLTLLATPPFCSSGVPIPDPDGPAKETPVGVFELCGVKEGSAVDEIMKYTKGNEHE